MEHQTRILTLGIAASLVAVLSFGATSVSAHCDGMDGPVVKAAQKALETNNVNLVLIWIPKESEAEITKAFAKTVAVRKLGGEARELADTWLFETLVRIHRAGEGEPYTGLKPAGRDLGPAIPAADKAVETGNIEPVLKLFKETEHKGLRERFAEVVTKQKYDKDNVEAGREFVHAYVIFIHHVDGLYQAANPSGPGGCEHGATPAAPASEQAHDHSAGAPSPSGGTAKFRVPQSLKLEHEELHAELVKATKAGGKIGEAATAVANVLHPHFVKEEDFALPPLGLLSAVAKGKITPEMREVLGLTDKLKAELPEMLAEHKAIVAALAKLKTAALEEQNDEVAHFAEKLTLHAQTEEEVMYPAAILIGEYLKARQ
jgi:hypothetical protein